jgi:hypothetical protein
MRRITKSLQLVVGQDDDLIAWFNSLPDGQGQQKIKETLRKGINGKGGSSPSPAPNAPPDETLNQILQSINNLPQALSLALMPVVMHIAANAGTLPPPSANYVPAYERQQERSYQIKRPSLEESFERSQGIIETVQETAEAAEAALENATAAFVNMFG